MIFFQLHDCLGVSTGLTSILGFVTAFSSVKGTYAMLPFKVGGHLLRVVLKYVYLCLSGPKYQYL